MSRKPFQFELDFEKELIVDLFAGGGGASCGIELALGVSPDIAINHDPEAIALHQKNHPKTLHFINDVFEINPSTVAIGRRVGLLWLSPDCKHFSKAKGGKPKDKKIRSLAWVGVKWAKAKRPRVIILENVEEFKDWGPVCKLGNVIEEKKGTTFELYVKKLERLGYKVEYRELRACDYGAPTTRKRFFMIARCDGKPIVWPKPTHGNNKGLKPYKVAADIIDWSIPSYSIFMTKEEVKKQKLGNRLRRPLALNTMERIAKGLKKFVIDSPNPYIAKNALPFITTYYGKSKNADATRGQSIDKPIATITSGGLRHGLVLPYVVGIDNKSSNGTWSAKQPLTTITSKARHCAVFAFLSKYYGQGEGQDLKDPIHTITTKDRFGLITVKKKQYQVQDIFLRMLTPRELFLGQGFPENYVIDFVKSNGKKLDKKAQVRMCGNSVPPPLVQALVNANYKIREKVGVKK